MLKLKLLRRSSKDYQMCTINGNNGTESVEKCERQKTIKCRKNAASILRTGAVLANRLKSNALIVNAIAAGANNPFTYKLHIEKIIRASHARQHEEIRKRHLLGLISSKAATIAKIEAIRCKQKTAIELKREKESLRNSMNEELVRSVSKSKVIVRGIRCNRLMLMKKRFDVANRKKQMADDVKKSHKKLHEEISSMRENEMKRKIDLIKRMKILEKRKALCEKKPMYEVNFHEKKLNCVVASKSVYVFSKFKKKNLIENKFFLSQKKIINSHKIILSKCNLLIINFQSCRTFSNCANRKH